VKYYESILDIVGNTPLVRLYKVAKGLSSAYQSVSRTWRT